MQRYEHEVLKLELTGADVLALLERQFAEDDVEKLHVSGLRYEHEDGRVTSAEVDDGRAVEPDEVYTVAANELIASGERFGLLLERARSVERVGTDLEALVASFQRDPAR